MSREKTRDRKSEGPVRRGLRNFRRDESAAVSLIAVATIFMVLAVATIVIDAGSILFARRTLQNATDAAALSAVQHL
ncbi:TadE/TadG family type IV pilus assembly protein, partial [Parvibaculum sp.]|uniref:TadE/TadG family type IV pilus assembly protein n=1 Tax=Parvibaculum sp. TaxID=2024848 RepID=UPI002BC4AA8D